MSDQIGPLAPVRYQYRIGILISFALGFIGLIVVLALGVDAARALAVFSFCLAGVAGIAIPVVVIFGLWKPEKMHIEPAPTGAHIASHIDVIKTSLRRVLIFVPILAVAVFLTGSVGPGAAVGGGLLLITIDVLTARWERSMGLTLMYEVGSRSWMGRLYTRSSHENPDSTTP